MKDFSKATPRPWKLIPDEKQCMISINTVDAESALDSSIAGLWGWRNKEGEPQMSDAELIVTAVNNYDDMKEACEALIELRDFIANHHGDDSYETPILDRALEAIQNLPSLE